MLAERWRAAARILVPAVLVAGGFSVTGARADDGAAQVWHVTVSPEVGATGFKGNGSVGPLSGRLRMPFHDVAKDTRFAFAGGVAASRGPVGFWLAGQYLDMSQNFTFDRGDVSGKAKGHATQLNAGGWYQAWDKSLGGTTVHGTPQQVTVSPLAGVRWTRLKATLDADGMSASQQTTWAIPFAGAQVSADLTPNFLMTAEADTGAWGRDFTLQGQAYLGYRLSILGLPAVMRVGYQALHQDHKETDLHWNVTQYGPVAGLSVTF